MELTAVLPSYRSDFLQLEYAASAAYNLFVYAGRDQANAVRSALFDAGVGEFAPQYSRVLLTGTQVFGAVSCMTAGELRKCRLRSAYLLARSGFYASDPDLPTRLSLAAQCLLRLSDGDYYLSRVASAGGGNCGRQLLGYCEYRAALAGASRVCLDVAAENENAIGFYERHGFERIGRQSVKESVTGRTLHYFHMAKTLQSREAAPPPSGQKSSQASWTKGARA